ncbi:MAG: MFS transporter [Actinobacteria bacterium]|nr:MFS transporter [Actinomycetota bacterium]
MALASISLAYGTFMAFVVLLLDAEGIGHGAAVFTAFTASFVLTRLLFGSLPDRIGPRPTALAGGLAQASGLVVIALAGSLPLVLAGALLAGGGMSVIFPSLALIVIRNTDPARRATAMGAYTAFFDLGVGAGAPLAGVIASLGSGTNYATAFIFGAVVSAGGTLIVLLGPQRRATPTNV